MRAEVQRQLAERLFRHIHAGTTDMADAMFRNPVSVYVSKERAAAERARLFRELPVLVALSCQVAKPGDFLTDDIAGMPIVVTRTESGSVEAFLNVCRHRGARVVDGCGEGRRALTCPYHAWTYDLHGRLIRIPGEDGFAGLDRAEHSLRAVPVAERHGTIWVRPSQAQPGEAPFDLDAYLGGLGGELKSYGLARYHHFETRTLKPSVNWKLVVDTFLEAYHLAALHGATVGPIFQSNLCLSDSFGPHNRMVAVRRSFSQVRAQAEREREFLRHTIELYTLFPNTVFVHQADHIEVWRVFPDREREDGCTLHMSFFVPDPVTSEKARKHWDANMKLAMDAIEGEDLVLAEAMQRGFYSGAQDCVTYGRNEPALIHFHRSLQAALG